MPRIKSERKKQTAPRADTDSRKIYDQIVKLEAESADWTIYQVAESASTSNALVRAVLKRYFFNL